jgi:formylmethanofuran dehydrogenase subunit C
MTVTLTLPTDPGTPVEIDGLIPERFAAGSLDDLRRQPIWVGRQQQPAGELFQITGDLADQEFVFQGQTKRLKRVGQAMSTGRIRVEGDVDTHCGAELTGGSIEVRGNAGDWAGAMMRGGLVQILGSAGHNLGGGYPGARKGMRGGQILVSGNAGDEIGCAMRRGLIAVLGQSGAAAGWNQLAGTIALFGPTAGRHGAGMRRGSIICFSDSPTAELLPTFRLAGVDRPVYLQVLLRHLAANGFAVPHPAYRGSFRRYTGDILELSRGELLIAN